MLSTIGLALDLVGAVSLAIGLFTHARPLYPGWSRPPEDVAHDAAFGVVGALFLVSGFALQSLLYFGVRFDSSESANLVAGVVALAAAALAAFLLYGMLFLMLLGRERGWAQRERNMAYPVRRQRKGLRFWRQVFDDQASSRRPSSLS